MKVGIHVGSLPNGSSDSYINGVTPPTSSKSVPEPSNLFGVGLAFGIATLFKANNDKKWKEVKIKA
ncbi:PEP-CTERM sorting domain-containing protein [Nostoc sp. FACHB-133]|uniref:PEP-CTERM sorting domain-containing protein n=1 Tax=Nostoc sp. FACHB-133 TaxID=2692835 RepID=UPI001F54F408|nr:PEP-CTERM sorting domain-containing protein [Nostoc sp. FACHB-133]